MPDPTLTGADIKQGSAVRPLSELEWQLVRPVFWAWLFLGVKDVLAAHYGSADPVSPIPALDWQIAHLRKHSALLANKAGALPLV